MTKVMAKVCLILLVVMVCLSLIVFFGIGPNTPVALDIDEWKISENMRRGGPYWIIIRLRDQGRDLEHYYLYKDDRP